ncbi:MAG: hypothetical protein V4640_14340 [Verrucomicrobiota bacterium]
MQTTAHSIDQVIIVGIIAGLAFAIFACRSQRFVMRLLLVLLALGLLLPSGILLAGRNPALIDARYRNYRFFYWSLGTGMSRDEVLTSLKKWYPPGKEVLKPHVVTDNVSRLEFVMDPGPSGQPRNERIVLKMEAGLVVGKEYAKDR